MLFHRAMPIALHWLLWDNACLYFFGLKQFSSEQALQAPQSLISYPTRSGWPSGLRRCVQVAVHFCGRGFESHFWQHFILWFISVTSWPIQMTLHSYQYSDTDSRVAQWKRAGPITQRSVDRNYALLKPFGWNSFDIQSVQFLIYTEIEPLTTWMFKLWW